LLGPMLTAIAAALLGTTLRVPKIAAVVVQAIFGCLIAAAISPELLLALREHGVLLVVLSAGNIALAALIGLVIARCGWLPGATAAWGLSPGAAPTMVLLSESHGADPRVVALMQYLRVVAVALTAVAIAATLGVHADALPASPITRDGNSPIGLAVAALLIGASSVAAVRLRNGAVALLMPAVLGGAIHASGIVDLALPKTVALITFALAGWAIGLRFTRESLSECWNQLPGIVGGMLALMTACGMLSMLLIWMAPGTNAMTAWLAVMPGGLDTAVAIAASVQVSLPLVIAAQLVRVGMVTLVAPGIARRLSRIQIPLDGSL
jgi:uncharacterized protein